MAKSSSEVKDDKSIEIIFLCVFLFGILNFFLIIGMQRTGNSKNIETIKENVLPEQTAIPSKKEKQLTGIKEKYKFELKYDKILSEATGMHSLAVCCPDGYPKEYYTYKMPWEFLLYEFAKDTPTIVVFSIDEKEKRGKFEIVLLDKSVQITNIKQSQILHFIKKVSDYMPGYSWEGDIRVELQ